MLIDDDLETNDDSIFCMEYIYIYIYIYGPLCFVKFIYIIWFKKPSQMQSACFCK